MREITPPSEDYDYFGSVSSDPESSHGVTEPTIGATNSPAPSEPPSWSRIPTSHDVVDPGLPADHPDYDDPARYWVKPGPLEEVVWQSYQHANMMNQAALLTDPSQASTSTGVRPHTRSKTNRIALERDRLATIRMNSYEDDALQDQLELHQESLTRCHDNNIVILDLPAHRVKANLTGRHIPPPLYTYDFRATCTLCNTIHPHCGRGTGCFMRSFMGPFRDIPSHVTTEIPPPTIYWNMEQALAGRFGLSFSSYGHRSQGIYLSPISHLLVKGSPEWRIHFRIAGCDGIREWHLQVLPEEVLSTLLTVLWLCRTSGDKWAAMTLFSHDSPAVISDYVGFIGHSPTLEVNHTYFPFPMWPNTQPNMHHITQ
jgi:hypothetical protein